MTQGEAGLIAGMLLSANDIASWFTETNLKRLAALREHRQEWMKVYIEAKRQHISRELHEAVNEMENRARMADMVHFSDLPGLPEALWIIDELVRRGSLSILAGDPKVGKSTLITHMVSCILQGKVFVDRTTTRARCLYYSLEEIGAEVKQRFLNYGLTDEPLYVREGYVPPSQFASILTADIAASGAEFVLIDPLFDIVEVESANDYVPVNRAIKDLLYVARHTGAHVCCIHHSAKGTGTILGAQSLRGGTDFNMYLLKDEKTGDRLLHSENRYGAALSKYFVRYRHDKTLTFQPWET